MANQSKLADLFREATIYCIREFGDSMQGGVTHPWDINNGCCEEWAQYVCDRLRGASLVWIDELAPELWDDGIFDGPSHCVVKYRGKLYDAECLTGVKDWHDLPVEQNKGKTREQVLSKVSD